MKLETLKTLINAEFKRSEALTEHDRKLMQDLKQYVNDAIDLYERDNRSDTPIQHDRSDTSIQYDPFIHGNLYYEKVPYHTICPCNPANGGSGICSCTHPNTMVKNPNN
jgi:hypothetical protein